jgi:hypothetical protein
MALKDAAEVVAGTLGKVYDVVAAGAADAARAENTNKQLAMSMASVGQYTEAAFMNMDEWSSSLERATGEEAEEETIRMLNTYADFCENILAIPVIKGKKTDKT